MQHLICPNNSSFSKFSETVVVFHGKLYYSIIFISVFYYYISFPRAEPGYMAVCTHSAWGTAPQT